MNLDTFTRWSNHITDWSAQYLATIRQRPVRAQTAPGDIIGQLPAAAPDAPEPLDAIFADFERIIMPGITHWQHPRFFAYFPANASKPSVLADQLMAVMGAQCMLWQTSPAGTELETRMMEWLRQMIGLPDGFAGVIQDSGSSATLAAILVGREKALAFKGNAEGLAGHPAVRVYCSDQAHSSIDKACWIAGIGQDNLVKLPGMGPQSGLDAEWLERAIVADKAAGYLPAVIVGIVGSTGVGASDDLNALADVAERHGLYLHVDAAWAGSAMICPEYRHFSAGAERADSVVFNPHKWLFTGFDCSAHFVRDPASLVKTLGIRPSYLETQGRDGIINYSEWSIPLGRRFRALKLWFVIRSYGVERLREMIRGHIGMAEGLCERLRLQPDFEIVTEPMLSLFSFRYRPRGAAADEALNLRLVQAINDDGRIYLTQTKHQGQLVIRIQVGQTDTDPSDIDIAFVTITQLARKLI